MFSLIISDLTLFLKSKLKEYHGEGAKQYPKIKTLVVKGKEDLSIRITDFGGGMSYRQVSQVWKYMYSTAPRPSISSDVYSTQTTAPLVNSKIEALHYKLCKIVVNYL